MQISNCCPQTLILKQVNHSGSGLNLVVLDACRNNPFGGRGLKSVASGLAEMTIPRGTLISYATQPGGVARDGPPGQNSPYAFSFAQTLVTPGLDILRTFNRVGVLVGKMTHQEQTPWVASSPIDGDYFLAGRTSCSRIARTRTCATHDRGQRAATTCARDAKFTA